MVYNFIIEKGSSLSVIGHIVKDIMSITNTLRTLFFFSHTRSQGNFVVHTLLNRARLSFPMLVCV